MRGAFIVPWVLVHPLIKRDCAVQPASQPVQEHERAATRLRQMEEAAVEARSQLQASKAEVDALAHKAARLRAEIEDAAAAAKRHRADEAAAAQVGLAGYVNILP